MTRISRFSIRILTLLGICAVVGVLVAAFFIEEPLRRWMEREINAPLKGYTVRIGGLDLHPFTFSLTLERVTVLQDAFPEPPIVEVPRIDGGIDWRALLSWALVTRVRVEQPATHLNLAQLRQEVRDPTPVTEKGWQEAIENVSPLDLNELRVIGGTVTYLDAPGAKPIQIDQLNVRASNIRNVRSEPGTYPSPLHVDARLLGAAPLEVDGAADFLAVPRAEGRIEFTLGDAPIERLEPAAKHFGLVLRGGHVNARGEMEATAKATSVVLREVSVRKVDADYVESTTAPTPEKEVVKKAAKKAGTASSETDVAVRLDALEIRESNFGFVNATVEPHYRLFVDVAKASLHDFSNGKRRKDAPLELDGTFMGSGSLRLSGTIHPDRNGPDLGLSLQMEKLDLRTLNDLLRAHGRLDVAGGELSVYSEVVVRDRMVNGYVKPLFVGLDVYDREQDRDKPLVNEIYQGAVGALATVLQNQPRDQVATVTPISGQLDAVDPDAWRSIVLLLRNAFIEAIRPGFEQNVGG